MIPVASEKRRSSLGGLVILTMICGYLLQQFVSRVIDGTHPVVTATGGVVFVSTSGYSVLIGIATILAVCALSLLALARPRLHQRFRSWVAIMAVLFVPWWLAAVWVLQREGNVKVAVVQVLLVAGLAAVLADLHRSMSYVASISCGMSWSSLAWSSRSCCPTSDSWSAGRTSAASSAD